MAGPYLSAMEVNCIPKDVHYGELATGKRPIGRPPNVI